MATFIVDPRNLSFRRPGNRIGFADKPFFILHKCIGLPVISTITAMSIFPHHWSSYGITRPVTLKWFNIVALLLGIICIVFITLINVVAVGNEYVSVIDNDYSDTNVNWYENFLPKERGGATPGDVMGLRLG